MKYAGSDGHGSGWLRCCAAIVEAVVGGLRITDLSGMAGAGGELGGEQGGSRGAEGQVRVPVHDIATAGGACQRWPLMLYLRVEREVVTNWLGD